MVARVGLVYRALPPSNGKVDWGSQGRAVREADKQDFTRGEEWFVLWFTVYSH